MTIRIKHSPHLPIQCRHSTSPANAATHAATPSTIVPQLVPLLDLLADLIAKDRVGERSESDARLEGMISEPNAMAGAPDDSALAETHGKHRSVSHFPSNVPPGMPPNSHSHSPVNELVTIKEKSHACDRSGDS
jgi:hypothetical protein